MRGAHQQRREIPRIERQHLPDRVERAVQVLALPPDRGEIEPGGDAGLVEAHGLEQRSLGGREIACRHGTQCGLVTTGGVAGGGSLIERFGGLFHAGRLRLGRHPPQGFAPRMLVGNNTALRVRRCRLSQCSLRAATSAHGECNSEHVSERSSRRFAQSVDIVLAERHIFVQEPLLRPSMTTEMLCSEAPCAMARTFTAAEPSRGVDGAAHEPVGTIRLGGGARKTPHALYCP